MDLFDHPPERGSGYRVEATGITWEGLEILTVPTPALFRANEAWKVFVVEDGRVRMMDVEPGRQSAEYAEVRSGLSEGPVVILHPTDQIVPGARVDPR